MALFPGSVARLLCRLTLLGGASAIGASCMLVRVGGMAIVVDGGVRYAGSNPLPDLALLAETPVDAVLLTHPHTDDSGGLPVILEACLGAPVLATPPTSDLVGILLQDALRMRNGPDREAELPLYSERQVERLLLIEEAAMNQPHSEGSAGA